jgi:hypothetical protein
MRKRPEDYENIVLLFPPGSPANREAFEFPVDLKLALIFNQRLPKLFMFSYFVHTDDGKLLFIFASAFPLASFRFQFRMTLWMTASGLFLCSFA